MRYIGSKRQVLPFIQKTITDTYGDFSNAVIGDLFAGTACVSEMFKKVGATVISNDYMSFSYALQIEKVKLNKLPESKAPYDELLLRLNQCDGIEGFFFKEYTCEGTKGKKFCRNYFSADNAKKIDAIRTIINEWLHSDYISEGMYHLLIANLIDAVTKVSNTSGTYGAFLKSDDPRKDLPVHLERTNLFDNGKINQCFCADIFDIIGEISGDILYLDPPYNNRQYPPYYHILDTVALYDEPAIYGKTGRRPYKEKLSPFCISDKAKDALVEIVTKAQFNHIYISYSTDGIISYKELIKDLEKIGETKCFFMPYRRYKSNSKDTKLSKTKLKEIIIYVQKRKEASRT